MLALVLAASTLVLSGCSFSDAEKHLRFGWPTGVTKQAERMRVLWSWSGVAALALGVIVWGLIFWACIRYRKRKGDDSIPRQTKYNLWIEVVCVAVPFVVILVLFWRTAVVENYVNKLSKDPDVMIQVDAFKWNWQFEYHDVHGKQVVYNGATDATTGEKNSPLYVSTIGSDSEIPVLVIPVNESVQIIEHSDDVIHSFWVPEFLFKRDVIPYGTEAQQKASGLTDNRFQITAHHRGQLRGPVRRTVRHLPLADELRGARGVTAGVHQLLEGAAEDRARRPGAAVEGADRRARPGRALRDDHAPLQHEPDEQRFVLGELIR